MKSEFATLHEMALAKGINHADLLEEIHKDILIEYYKNYPDSPKEVTIVVDTTSGKVSVMSGKKDVTPPEFASEAESIARKVLIGKLKEAPGKVKTKMPKPPVKTKITKKKKALPFLAQLIFFGYNSIFILGLVLFLFGFLNPDFRVTLIETLNEIGIFKSLVLAAFMLIPPSTVGFALKTKLRKKPRELAKLFFLLEIPLLTACLLPLSLGAQATPVTWFFALMLILVPLALYSFESPSTELSSWLAAFNLGINEVVLLTTGYLTLLISFFIPLLIGGVAKYLLGDLIFEITRNGFASYLNYIRIGDIFWFLIMMFFLALGLVAILSVTLLPFLIIFVIWKKFIRLYRQVSQSYGLDTTHYLLAAIAIFYLISFGAASYQRDPRQLIDLLEGVTVPETFEEREKLVTNIIPKKNKIRQALLDVYEARSRYLWIKGDNNLSRAYQDIFNLNENAADYLQDVFDKLAYPFVYQIEIDKSATAAQNYQYIFGEPFKDPYPKSETKPNVELVSRTIEAKTAKNNMAATITIEEEYKNTTRREQEVIYEFSLPNEAVVTQLKLGPSLEFEGVIAPKGAAQRTYEQQIRRRRDPALLEQTGPRQYRLRVYPIPSKRDRTTLNGKNQKVQFSYVVNWTNHGYPLPVYSKKSNVFTSASTEKYYFLNNKSISISDNNAFIKSTRVDFNPCRPSVPAPKYEMDNLTAELVFHQNNQLLTTKPDCTKSTKSYPQLDFAKNLDMAILYEASHKNKGQFINNLKDSLARNPDFLDNNNVDLYKFNDLISQPITLKPDNLNESLDLVYFGESQPFTTLKEFYKNYDLAIVVIGEKETFALNDIFPNQLDYPVYLIHANELIPAYHQEFTTQAIKNSGQIVDSLDQAISHYVVSQQLVDNRTITHLKTGPYWSIILKEQASRVPLDEINQKQTPKWPFLQTSQNEPLSYLVSQAYLLHQVKEFQNNVINNLDFLDETHAFAEQTHIVTPYSSLIALVNQQQMEELKRQSRSERRYEERAMRTDQPNWTGSIDLTPSGQWAPLEKGGIFNQRILDMGATNGGGGLAPAGAFAGGGGGGISFLPFGSLFIIANLGLFAIGTTVFLIYSLKKRKKK